MNTIIKFVVSALIAALAILTFAPAPFASADPVATPEKVVNYVYGMDISGKTKTASPIVASDGSVIKPVWYDNSQPLGMVETSRDASAKLVEQTIPDANGNCFVAGNSLGTLAAYEALPQLAEKCNYVEAKLSASPASKGSVSSMLPSSPLVDFSREEIPANVDVTWQTLKYDGLATCGGWGSTGLCVAGALVEHYCVGSAYVDGTCYDTFTGETVKYSTAPNQHFEIGQTRNPFGVLTEFGMRVLVDPSFSLTEDQYAQLDQAFPAATPGTEAPGSTVVRDLIEPKPSAEVLSLQEQAVLIVEPIRAEVEKAVEPLLQNTVSYTSNDASYEATPATYNTAPAQIDYTPIVENTASTATSFVDNAVASNVIPADLGAQLNNGINDLAAQGFALLGGK